MPVETERLHRINHEYSHRINPDGTWDSICKKCFMTIAHGSTEIELADSETTHICNSSFLADRGRLSDADSID